MWHLRDIRRPCQAGRGHPRQGNGRWGDQRGRSAGPEKYEGETEEENAVIVGK